MQSARAFYTEEIVAGRYEIQSVLHIGRYLPVDIYDFTLKAAAYRGVNSVILRIGKWQDGMERCTLVLWFASGLKNFDLPPLFTLAQAEELAEEFRLKQ